MAGMVSSQARVAAAGSVIPAGFATGAGAATAFAVVGEVCCAGKAIEETTRATLKQARRRIIRELLKEYRRDWKPVPKWRDVVVSGVFTGGKVAASGKRVIKYSLAPGPT